MVKVVAPIMASVVAAWAIVGLDGEVKISKSRGGGGDDAEAEGWRSSAAGSGGDGRGARAALGGEGAGAAGDLKVQSAAGCSMVTRSRYPDDPSTGGGGGRSGSDGEAAGAGGVDCRSQEDSEMALTVQSGDGGW